jgi:hypothetical protein
MSSTPVTFSEEDIQQPVTFGEDEIEQPKAAKSYRTNLSPPEERGFQSWVKENRVPYQDSPTADYDMRGFYKAKQSGDPIAAQAPNGHYPDKWKTPYHKTFSNESMYATPDAPHWEGSRLVGKDGRVVADESEDSTTLANRELAKQGLSVSAPPTKLPAVEPVRPIGPYPEYKSKVSPEKREQFKQETAAQQSELLAHPVEMAGNLTYPGLGTAARGVPEMAQPGRRVRGALRTVEGITEGMQPLMGPAALENPVPLAVGMATGTAASKVSGKVAENYMRIPRQNN